MRSLERQGKATQHYRKTKQHHNLPKIVNFQRKISCLGCLDVYMYIYILDRTQYTCTCTTCKLQNKRVFRNYMLLKCHIRLLIHCVANVHVKLSNSLNYENTINQRQCQVIVKDPEKKPGSCWDSNPGPSDY